MPTNRRRRGHTRREDITEAHIHQLFCGRDYFGKGYGNGPDFDEDLAREHWRAFSEEILELYSQSSNCRPDRPRPWAFYYFEEGRDINAS
jgi:hypothetical protein